MDRSHTGRVVLVTGGSSGIGAHAARRLATAGARVAIGARRADRLAAMAAEITAAGGACMTVDLDVQEEASVIAACDAVEARFGGIDTVVAAAGISRPGAAIRQDIAAFDETIRVNLRGAFLTARETAGRMIARQQADGRILLVASVGAHNVLPGVAAYCASKAGVAMLGRSLALEWARHGIAVNTLCPGYVRTEMNDDWFSSDAGSKQIAAFPRRRLMPLEALDPMILELTGQGAQFTTGAVITVDDGQFT